MITTTRDDVSRMRISGQRVITKQAFVKSAIPTGKHVRVGIGREQVYEYKGLFFRAEWLPVIMGRGYANYYVMIRVWPEEIAEGERLDKELDRTVEEASKARLAVGLEAL